MADPYTATMEVVGIVARFVLSPEGYAQWAKRRERAQRTKTAIEMVKHARTPAELDAVAEYLRESARLSSRP